MVHHLYTKVELHERTSSTQAAAAIDPSANQTPTPSELREAAGATTAPFSYSNINRDACFNNEKEPPQESSCFLIRQQRTENKNASQAYTDGLEPNVSKNSTFPHQASLTMLLRQYFNNIGTLYPVICDIVAMNSASIIALKGYEDNINVCITLLLVALGKEAYNCVGNDGLAAFHGAIAMLNRLQFEFTLEFTQAEVLAGIYLYRKGKVLEAWKHIHGGCTTLYVMTKRYVYDSIL